MRTSLREFSRNPSTYLDKLPLDLTIYGRCVATIIPFGGKVSTDIKKVSTDVAKKDEFTKLKRELDAFRPVPKTGIKGPRMK